MSITPQYLRKLLDEREASRGSRKRAWENLQEIRWVIKDIAGIDLPPPARKTIDPEGRVVKDGVRTVLRDRLAAHASVQHQSFRPVNRLVQFLDSLSEIRPPCNVRGVFSASFRYLRIASINSLRANPAMEEGIAGMGSATTD